MTSTHLVQKLLGNLMTCTDSKCFACSIIFYNLLPLTNIMTALAYMNINRSHVSVGLARACPNNTNDYMVFAFWLTYMAVRICFVLTLLLAKWI